VSVDSRQVYRRMDIGTGKPTPAERQRLPHHLIDVVEPDEVFDAARFAREAATAIDDIRRRRRWPLLVGGTGLYLRALLHGLAPLPPADLGLRRQLRVEAAAQGREVLHRRLTERDPATAARLHPRDLIRVIRALEIALVTGMPASAVFQGARRRAERPYRALTIGLTMGRDALYRVLDARVERMLSAGLLGEVEGLLTAGFGPELPAMQGIGYRHLAAVLEQRTTVAEAARTMKRDTRRYAKRQWTWFARGESPYWITVEPENLESAVSEAKKLVERTGIFR
jgi:tRNA dimethylallyltransferase